MISVESQVLDEADRILLDELQRDGRATVASLARVVKLSATAVNARLARLQDAGVITSFTAVVNPAKLGHPLTAYVRVRLFQGVDRGFRSAVQNLPEVLECHHTTGEDCYLLRVVARDMSHLEELTGRIGGYGDTTTALVYSSVVERRHFTG